MWSAGLLGHFKMSGYQKSESSKKGFISRGRASWAHRKMVGYLVTKYKKVVLLRGGPSWAHWRKGWIPGGEIDTKGKCFLLV